MIEAKLRTGDEGPTRGTFRFLCAPSAGDQIHVGNRRGSMDILRVLYVEHHPVELPPGILLPARIRK